MNLESFMTKKFIEGAKKQELKMKEGKYSYKFYVGRYMDILGKQGICIILSRRYDRKEDCDCIEIQDVSTLEIIYANQFSIRLDMV